MPYFQNVFTQDFEGNWLLGDRHLIPKFVCRRNFGRGDEMVVSWNRGPHDLSGNDSDGNPSNILKIVFALNDRKNWQTIQVDVSSTASSINNVLDEEIVNALNSDSNFSAWFEAFLGPSTSQGYNEKKVVIKQRKNVTHFWFYIDNGQAEEILRFNAKAGVAELPTYFSRHTIENRFNFEDSQNMLIELDPTSSNVHANIIQNAMDAYGNSLGYNPSVIRQDWQLLEGRSGLFDFTNNDGSSNPNTKIVYPAGAKAGDLAMKIITTSDGKVFKIPYTLTSSDLISPP